IFMSRIIRVYAVTLVGTVFMYVSLFFVKPEVFSNPTGYIPRIIYMGSHSLGLLIAYRSESIKGIWLSVFVSVFFSTCAIEGILIVQPWHAMPKYILFLIPLLVALMLPVRIKEILPISIGLPVIHACTLPWHQTSDPALEIVLMIISGIFAVVSVQITDGLRRTNAIKEALILREQSKFWSLQKQLEKSDEERTYKLEEQSIQLGFLSREIQDLEHKERERMASLLHDHLQQHLAAAKIQTQLVRQEQDPQTRSIAWAAIDEALSNAIGVTRSITASVAPNSPTQNGLHASLYNLKAKLESQFGLHTELILDKKEPKEPLTCSLFYDCARELLFNVIKHSGIKQAELNLYLDENQDWCLRVSDQGVGYVQEEGIKNESFGLQILRRRIEQVEGILDIRSSPDNGVTACVKIPPFSKRHPLDATKDSNAVGHSSSSYNRFAYSKTRIVIADDHEEIREEISHIINTVNDIEIVGQAKNGQEALDITLEQEPDILVIDMNTSKRSGLEITKIIRQRTEKTRVIGFSSSDSARIAQQFIAYGGDAYLLKSMLPSHLLNAIRTTKKTKDWILFRSDL
ncbi:MAG: response regulator, partial [Myxococcota bacterium]|nr:response regulator [Myxococcota bacterium]